MPENKNPISLMFLKEFTKELIINSRPKEEIFPQEEIYQKFSQSEAHLNEPVSKFPAQAKFAQLLSPIIPKTKELPLYQSLKIPVTFPKQLRIKPQQSSISPLHITESELAGEKQPQGFSLGKLDMFLNDINLTEIECPGPGKLILVKSFNRVSLTKLFLTQQEIHESIEKFSKAAKIPILGGLFKAAVGNFVMTAVVSEVVGTRFIIKKVTPFSI